MAFDTKKFLARFIEESRKHITQLSSGLIALEQNPDDREQIDTIFRAAHTIKGSSNMMNFEVISEFAHTIENSLSMLREGKAVLDKDHTDILLKCVDILSSMLDEAEESRDITPPSEELLKELSSLQNRTASEEHTRPESPQPEQTIDTDQKTSQTSEQPDRRKKRRVTKDTFIIKTEKLDNLIKLISELSLWNINLESSLQEINNTIRLSNRLHKSIDSDTPHTLTHAIQELKSSTDRLATSLMNDIHTLNQLNIELRETLLNIKLVPIAVIFEKLPRVVREVSARFGKKINFTMSGADTELDKTIIDMIDESMIQMIRNAIDHGIEPPETREQAGKPALGNIAIHAGYERGMCRIQITDDGAGVNVPQLLKNAQDRGLISTSEAERIRKHPTSEAIANLMFTPGLSASRIITDLSGRGVGMDIVHENIIRKLNGSVKVDTTPGQGTTITIWLPLNTAMMNVTIFRIGDRQLAVPTPAIVEILRTKNTEMIEVVDRTALRRREQIIPIVRLNSILKIDEEASRQTQNPLVLIIRTGSGQVALITDEIIMQDNFVINSLPDHMKDTPWVSGCVITGSFTIVNLLNSRHLLEFSQQNNQKKSKEPEHKKIIKILVVDDSISTRDIEKSILESYGYQVELASDGQEAYELTQDHQYDLVITDIEMPRMDGITLTKTLRKEKAYRHTPIILVSSRDSREDKAKGAQAGADAYIVKSAFDQNNLIQTIKTLVG